MTMPHERFRSVTRMPEMLAAAAADSKLDPKLRARARALLEHYPDEAAVRLLVASKRQGLPDEVAAALDEAIGWLQDLRMARELSAELISWRRWILRHFPERWEVTWQRDAVRTIPGALWSSVDQWIRPEQ
jgi:hypothetical protein